MKGLKTVKHPTVQGMVCKNSRKKGTPHLFTALSDTSRDSFTLNKGELGDNRHRTPEDSIDRITHRKRVN
jgi:hypothetical protein